ncbi:MAG: ABC transporter permease [Pirellulaceae bacterium]|jgi:lipoprotein-releasing system permease protein|nr:ABC transporter permease [Pirellulaceae bacterium]
MYKILLSWRYLRTRFIALASIVSVTLGVATMIVVNSVMAGFVSEMRDRLHGILSDIEIKSMGLDGIEYADAHMREVERVLGDDLESITGVVQVPALMNFSFRGNYISQPVILIGIDDKTFGDVCDFKPYLMNVKNQRSISFDLRSEGYDEKIGDAGWDYRREREETRRAVDELIRASEREQVHSMPKAKQLPKIGEGVSFAPIPTEIPDLDEISDGREFVPGTEKSFSITGFDRDAERRRGVSAEERFNPARDQYVGVVLGISIARRHTIDPENGDQKSEVYLLRPGDDVQLNLFTAGRNPTPIAENFTIVDFYSSNMHEYDSNFCFMPLSKLQKLRGMIDPLTGLGAVSAIQIRLKEGRDLNRARDALIERFPPYETGLAIQTWEDIQRPLLSAVNLEITILNILLFLIIAVAGFGILATFFMIVVEKTKDIGILKALGASNQGVMSIFLSYGLSLGSVGTGVGVLLGLLFVWNINEIADMVEWMSGREVFDPTLYYFSEIPTILNPVTITIIGIGAILIAVLASVFPALRAARLHPVEALRYE